MASDFDVLFGLRSLNGRVEAFGDNVLRTRVFQNKFAMGRDLMTEDGNVEWDELTFSRGLAPVTGRRGRFVNKAELSYVNRRSAVADIKQSVDLNPDRLFFQRQVGSLRPGAEAYVEEEIRDLTNRISNTIEYFAAESLRGTLTVNSANIPDTRNPFTITYSPNTYTANNSWATAGTGILSAEVPALKIDFEQNCGFTPAQAICGSTVEGYFTGNTECTTFLQYTLGERVLTTAGTTNGPLFGGVAIGGLSWTITEGGYVPEGGSFTRYLPTTDEAIVLPADSELRDVLGMAQGRGLVPQQLLGPASAAAGLVTPAPSPGWYSYATLEKDVPTIRLHVGWCGLPIVMRPAAVQVANLVP